MMSSEDLPVVWGLREMSEWAKRSIRTLQSWRSNCKGDPRYDYPIIGNRPIQVDRDTFIKWYQNRNSED